MDLMQFTERIIADGIEAAKADYSAPRQKEKRNGSIAGFQACRQKSPRELRELLEAANTATDDAYNREAKDYWWYRCYAAEVEWVCNCVSAVLMNQGLPTIIAPTARGCLKAAEIVGVAED